MTKEYSNEDFGFGSSAYAEPSVKKEEDKIARSPSNPAKIQQAAVTAAAPIASAVTPPEVTASAAALPPLPTASAGAPPAISNPAESADFWSGALKGIGIPVGLGLAAGAGAGYLGGRFGNKGGVSAGPSGPTGPSELEQVKVERERFKLEQDMNRAQREQAAYEAKLAAQTKPSVQPITGEIPQPTYPSGTTAQQPAISGYGQTNINVPTGAPQVAEGVNPPVEAPVVQKPPTAEELRVRAFEADQRRRDELHQAKLAREKAHADSIAAKAAITKDTHSKAAKSAGGTISPTDAALLNNEIKGKAIAEAAAAQQRAIAEAVKPPAAAPVTSQPTAPVVVAPQAATPVAEAAVPPNAKPAGKWPGGAEGSALQLFGGTKKNLTPGSMASLEMFKEHIGGPLTMPTTGGTIHQIDQASKFYEKYTGEPLPRSPEGKLTRIPEEQIAKLHSGIQSELEGAVKGGKLQSLGKGAMAAAALLGLTTAVQAAQKGDFGPLEEAGFSGLVGKLIGGTAATLLTPGEASAPVVGYTKEEQQTRNVAQRPGVKAYAEILKNRLSGEEYNKAISEFAATNPKRGDYAAMQELFRQQAEAKKAKLKR